MRAIDADAIIKCLFSGKVFPDVHEEVYDYEYEDGYSLDLIIEMIENAPTIDPVHAVGGCYCRECTYMTYDNMNKKRWCSRTTGCVEVDANGNGFCSHGKRSGKEE